MAEKLNNNKMTTLPASIANEGKDNEHKFIHPPDPLFFSLSNSR